MQAKQAILVTVDTVILTLLNRTLHVLLVQRGEAPYLGQWALPGGIVDERRDHTLDMTAYRKLREKTGVDSPYLEQVMTCGSPDRDPRGYSVSVLYMALLNADRLKLHGNQQVTGVEWVPLNGNGVARPLAFDHARLLASACERLRAKAEYSSLVMHLLPDTFTFLELYQTYSDVLGVPLHKTGFRRRVMKAGVLVEVDAKSQQNSPRPAQLYRLNPAAKPACFETNLLAYISDR